MIISYSSSFLASSAYNDGNTLYFECLSGECQIMQRELFVEAQALQIFHQHLICTHCNLKATSHPLVINQLLISPSFINGQSPTGHSKVAKTKWSRSQQGCKAKVFNPWVTSRKPLQPGSGIKISLVLSYLCFDC